MAKKHHYMTYHERLRLEAYLKAGKSVAWIAEKLGFSERTIYYEKKRGEVFLIRNPRGIPIDTKEYSADKAQQIHSYNQTAKGRPLKIGNDHSYASFLENKILNDHFSPAAALAEARNTEQQTTICTSTLYSYIDKGIFWKLTNKDLLIKGKRKKRRYRKIQRIAHPLLPSISNRPQKINDRSEYGHWEMDLVVGKRGKGAALLTLTERQTRQELIFKIPDKKASSIQSVFDRMEKKMKNFKNEFKSITTDNGSEFLQYEQLRKSIYGGARFEIYYCHSYAAWEKGSNENHNRMIRRFFPKGTNFNNITKKQIQAVQHWMNHYPRKVLNWETPSGAAKRGPAWLKPQAGAPPL